MLLYLSSSEFINVQQIFLLIKVIFISRHISKFFVSLSSSYLSSILLAAYIHTLLNICCVVWERKLSIYYSDIDRN